MPITMSFQIFLSAEQQAKLEKMRSGFLAWNVKFTKKMEEHMRKIKSWFPPRPSPTSQSLLITPTSSATAITKKRKKRAVEATKIHPHRRPTKQPSTSRRLAHLSRKFRKHRTQPSKRAVINSRRASTPLGVTCVHCGGREIKKIAFVWI
jgi:hypothetical protein